MAVSIVSRVPNTVILLRQRCRGRAHQRAAPASTTASRGARWCFIRVFLNLPDANGQTPLDHPNYAGYLAVFGHGDCYGGPGHCETPPQRPRKYDLRPRNHNTPRNHRVHVTKAARKLIAGGATALQITLVVIGVDYQEDNELLRTDGVSLNFFD